MIQLKDFTFFPPEELLYLRESFNLIKELQKAYPENWESVFFEVLVRNPQFQVEKNFRVLEAYKPLTLNRLIEILRGLPKYRTPERLKKLILLGATADTFVDLYKRDEDFINLPSFVSAYRKLCPNNWDLTKLAIVSGEVIYPKAVVKLFIEEVNPKNFTDTFMKNPQFFGSWDYANKILSFDPSIEQVFAILNLQEQKRDYIEPFKRFFLKNATKYSHVYLLLKFVGNISTKEIDWEKIAPTLSARHILHFMWRYRELVPILSPYFKEAPAIEIEKRQFRILTE